VLVAAISAYAAGNYARSSARYATMLQRCAIPRRRCCRLRIIATVRALLRGYAQSPIMSPQRQRPPGCVG